MCKSLGKNDFGKVGLLAIVFVKELDSTNGNKPSNYRKALEKAMTSDLLKLSRKEIEEMAVKAKVYTWGWYSSFTNDAIETGNIFKTPFYKHRTTGNIVSDIELIRIVETCDNIEQFYQIGLYLTKETAIESEQKIHWTPSPINVLDLKHIKYLAEN
jgi:hypothetical protein